MSILKKILFTTIIILSVYSSQAQISFKEPVSYKLKNGMNIIISENNQSAKAFSNFTLDTRNLKNRKDGVIELLMTMIGEGTGKNNNISFKDRTGNISTITANFDEELQNMAAAIQNISFSQNTFNTAKAKLMLSLKAQDYDYDQTVNENSIMALSLADVTDFYNQITPSNFYLTVAGDVHTDEAKTSVKKAFGNWNKKIQKDQVLEIAE
ncbi:insulinase family protein [Pedobacter punctiformis]|uniref:Insulinase family protein n=1 Tax=Pedobacter punctiformis TaxID=3004097 RepID=A0ABT4LBL9_9SPHI|nr:insulinase family protein [Pedobacter sp. HCMS5-2]MCZ4245305.1 insulinase family protein [Pedobacter sp. HCMS5-2]